MIDYDGILGTNRYFIWSKENQIWRTFFRTIIAGHWKKEDAVEYMKMTCYYEIMFDHSLEREAQEFALNVLSRDSYFKAAKVSKLALNNVKTLILLGLGDERKLAIKTLAKQAGFEFYRVRDKNDSSEQEKSSRKLFAEYLENLSKAFAPTGGLILPPGQ